MHIGLRVSYDHTLYAHWSSKYKVTFDANGGHCSVSSKVYDEGTKYGELPEAERNNKKFLGWFTRRTEGTKVKEEDIIENKDHTLYAHWGEITYTITYNTNGGSLVVPSVLEKGAPITLPEVTKDGFSFDGWFLDPNFVEPFTLTSMPAKDIVLYAKWKEGSSVLVEIVVPIVCAVIGSSSLGTVVAWCCCCKHKKDNQGSVEMNNE